MVLFSLPLWGEVLFLRSGSRGLRNGLITLPESVGIIMANTMCLTRDFKVSPLPYGGELNVDENDDSIIAGEDSLNI